MGCNHERWELVSMSLVCTFSATDIETVKQCTKCGMRAKFVNGRPELKPKTETDK